MSSKYSNAIRTLASLDSVKKRSKILSQQPPLLKPIAKPRRDNLPQPPAVLQERPQHNVARIERWLAETRPITTPQTSRFSQQRVDTEVSYGPSLAQHEVAAAEKQKSDAQRVLEKYVYDDSADGTLEVDRKWDRLMQLRAQQLAQIRELPVSAPVAQHGGAATEIDTQLEDETSPECSLISSTASARARFDERCNKALALPLGYRPRQPAPSPSTAKVKTTASIESAPWTVTHVEQSTTSDLPTLSGSAAERYDDARRAMLGLLPRTPQPTPPTSPSQWDFSSPTIESLERYGTFQHQLEKCAKWRAARAAERPSTPSPPSPTPSPAAAPRFSSPVPPRSKLWTSRFSWVRDLEPAKYSTTAVCAVGPSAVRVQAIEKTRDLKPVNLSSAAVRAPRPSAARVQAREKARKPEPASLSAMALARRELIVKLMAGPTKREPSAKVDSDLPQTTNLASAAVCRTEPPALAVPFGENASDAESDCTEIDHAEWEKRLSARDAKLRADEPEPKSELDQEPDNGATTTFIGRLRSWACDGWAWLKSKLWA